MIKTTHFSDEPIVYLHSFKCRINVCGVGCGVDCKKKITSIKLIASILQTTYIKTVESGVESLVESLHYYK